MIHAWCVLILLGAGQEEAKLQPPDVLPPAPAGQKWRLLWHDEFDSQQIEESKWNIPECKIRDAWWTRKAVALDGQGRLRMRVFKEEGRYYDAGIHTRGKFEHTFGYFVVRMQLQQQPGHWSAFWLWNNDMPSAKERFEIDIMERPWLDDRIQHTFHWGPSGTGHRSLPHQPRIPGVEKGWHTFALWWTPEKYVFYVDGKKTWEPKEVPIWKEPLYILITDEIQFGGWAGDIRKAAVPDEFLVDYVRVYELVDAQTGRPVHKP
ncbi:MAG TPA: glycoside hydrolase family 16 protein [Thermoguttaceae bacterium]|nr:glycoside hydrolase family 16 protein [Thermoguttaceae bacterium]HPP52793.1 glycoside hydrolase family 16 protein [Thermoguttaceae bacterium]